MVFESSAMELERQCRRSVDRASVAVQRTTQTTAPQHIAGLKELPWIVFCQRNGVPCLLLPDTVHVAGNMRMAQRPQGHSEIQNTKAVLPPDAARRAQVMLALNRRAALDGRSEMRHAK